MGKLVDIEDTTLLERRIGALPIVNEFVDPPSLSTRMYERIPPANGPSASRSVDQPDRVPLHLSRRRVVGG